MTALQVSIGALNDIVDAPTDAVGNPAKPIPAGLAPSAAWAVMIGGAGIGLGLTAATGPAVAIVAGAGLMVGYAYDLWFKGTIWSWVPFAVGIPLLPVFAWLGGAGSLPDAFSVLLPMAVLAGAGIAVANARADLDRDRAAGVDSVAIRLGDRRAWVVNTVLLAVVVAIALGSMWGRSASTFEIAAAIGAGMVIGLGIVAGYRSGPRGRQRAWETQAIGLGLLAAAWLAGVGGRVHP